jgi:hypothetical protein
VETHGESERERRRDGVRKNRGEEIRDRYSETEREKRGGFSKKWRMARDRWRVVKKENQKGMRGRETGQGWKDRG